MSLLSVRQNFIKLSGRYDLATTDSEEHDTDAGADFYIKAGQDWLDTHQVHPGSKKESSTTLSANGYYADFARCLAIDGAWYLDDNSERQKLEYRDWNRLVFEYPKLGSETASEPYAWALYDSGTAWTRRIYIMPPTDEERTIYVFGRFMEAVLSENATETFWTEALSGMILVHAGLYMLMLSLSNSEGMRDEMNALMTLLNTVEYGVSLQESAGTPQMGG